MAFNLDPIVAVAVGGLFWLILFLITSILSVFREKYKIDERHIMRSWDLVEIFGGMLFGFIFGGGVT